MKIEYTAADAAKLVRGFFALPDNNTRAARFVRAAYVDALRACGVQCAHIERGKVHVLRVFAPDGQDFIKKGAARNICIHDTGDGYCTAFDKPCDKYCGEYCDEYEEYEAEED